MGCNIIYVYCIYIYISEPTISKSSMILGDIIILGAVAVTFMGITVCPVELNITSPYLYRKGPNWGPNKCHGGNTLYCGNIRFFVYQIYQEDFYSTCFYLA